MRLFYLLRLIRLSNDQRVEGSQQMGYVNLGFGIQQRRYVSFLDHLVDQSCSTLLRLPYIHQLSYIQGYQLTEGYHT